MLCCPMLAWSTGNTIAVVTLVVAGIGIPLVAIYVAGRRRKADKTDRQTKADVESRAQLEAAHPAFSAEARPIAQGTVLRDEGAPPVSLSVQGDSVWVHAVELVWRYNHHDDGDWRGPAAACTPRQGVVLPAQLTQGRSMGFTWSADQPPKVGQLAWELHVTWGLGARGRTMVTRVTGGDTNWQYG
jgi:hypothetical protein